MNILPSFAVMKDMTAESLQELQDVMVQDIVDRAPEHMRARLRGLQFQIDMERKKHSNPLARTIAISRMMQESLSKLVEVMNGTLSQPQKSGEVVPFVRSK